MGTVAKRQSVTNPENTVYSIKRFMGRRFDVVSQEMKLAPYKVVPGENNDARVDINGKKYSPPEISAMILGKLKEAAWGYTLEGDSWEPPQTLPEGLRALTVAGVPELFDFPRDMQPVPAEINRLNDQILVRYYEKEWKDIAR
jgi:hypothetical protein